MAVRVRGPAGGPAGGSSLASNLSHRLLCVCLKLAQPFVPWLLSSFCCFAVEHHATARSFAQFQSSGSR
jgi:hypothetical protein